MPYKIKLLVVDSVYDSVEKLDVFYQVILHLIFPPKKHGTVLRKENNMGIDIVFESF